VFFGESDRCSVSRCVVGDPGVTQSLKINKIIAQIIAPASQYSLDLSVTYCLPVNMNTYPAGVGVNIVK